MRFEFQREPGSPVRVIPVIEDHPIARLEGRNGIGKTMAIRLLQLCTGSQPYGEEDHGLWVQLRERLGEITIRCTNLEGATEIAWSIDPRLWPDEPQKRPSLVGNDEHAGICSSVTVDGAPADLGAIQALLRVHRLIGDETLGESIDHEVQALYGRTVDERSLVDHRAEAVRKVIGDLRAAVEKADQATVEVAEAELRDRREELAEAQAGTHLADKRHDELKALFVRQQQLESLLDEHEDPEAYLGELEARLKQIREDQVTARAQRESLDLRAEVEAQALGEIEELESRIAGHTTAREEALEEAREFASRLRLASIPTSVAEAAFKGPDAEARERLAELRALQATLDAGPQVRELGDRVLEVLDDEQVDAIKEQTVATLEPDRHLSVDDLSEGIRLRQSEIEEETRSPRDERLAEAISEAQEVVEAFEGLAHCLRRTKRRETELRKARDQLRSLAEGLTGSEGTQFAELEARLQALAQEETEAEAERTHLLQQMGQIASGTSTATLKQRLQQDLEAADTSTENVAEDLKRQETYLRGLRDAQHDLVLAVESADATLQAALAEQKEALAQMASEERWNRLRDAELLPLSSLGDEESQERGRKLLEACDHAEGALDDVSSLVADQLVAGFVAAVQRDEPASEPVARVVRQVEESLGRRYFGEPTVAEALFGGGELLRFDLIDNRIDWQPNTGEPFSRHLRAFSSGERAFAYTKARLERLRDDLDTQNRFVALDEFGAFLERARLELLEKYLSDEVVGRFVDQALIILPLSRSSSGSEPFITIPYEP